MVRLSRAKSPTEITSLKTLKSVKDEYLKLAEQYNSIINNEIILCNRCGEWRLRKEFFPIPTNETGYFPVCKQCMKFQSAQMENKNDCPDETEESFKNALRFIDLPFHRDLYEQICREFDVEKFKALGSTASVKEKMNGLVFVPYVDAILKAPMYNSQKWKDSDSEEIKGVETKTRIKKETINRFGQSYSTEDLVFLQNEYDDWVRRYECNTKAQEECFQRLAVTKLQIAHAGRKGKSTKELEAIYKSWMDSANVTPRQNAADTLSQAQTYGTLIQKLEMERPVRNPDPDLQDQDKVLSLLRVILGHTCKAAGFKSGYNEDYARFMRDYTVQRQEYQDEDADEEMFSSYFEDET
ncbi:hypothetical protein [Ileibacterium valens]|uniref:hypothetical protein n=1 Tax=Ileibacterium valens TaxID=1862668 RepID=UPI0027301646|nr:hypothetical protein [Ileibacterium valens]